jgi:hypothetical protein
VTCEGTIEDVAIIARPKPQPRDPRPTPAALRPPEPLRVTPKLPPVALLPRRAVASAAAVRQQVYDAVIETLDGALDRQAI